uniref:Uncharacterized protein n=1 Tax=Candidatus Kentrum sp. LPFa TaxID=2126335 RepID=A0A450WES6_9GAMM|nr:MAG: hypothetical protein BECKLPF1236A_GA0070988_1012712 [Candidatus Kentron sp. LPFa]VFK30774.1 MAG: hypothetical protein BECKLPF1236C_GA0070990_1011913 [Candidatus Kentron sp. LPFa]
MLFARNRSGTRHISCTLAEQIDAHRKRQQQQHPDLTLTGIYNVLEKLRRIDNRNNSAGIGGRRGHAESGQDAAASDFPATADGPSTISNKASAISYEPSATSYGPSATSGKASAMADESTEMANTVSAAASGPRAITTSGRETLTAKEKKIHEQGLVSVLRQLHDELGRAVFEAYGWGDLVDRLVGRLVDATPWLEKPDDQSEVEEELLQCLVELNHQRAAEEQRGLVRWLRPEYQNPEGTTTQEEIRPDTPTAAATGIEKAKAPWPKTLPEQVQALRAALDRYPEPATVQQLAKTFTRAQSKRVGEILDTLVSLGQAREENGRYA